MATFVVLFSWTDQGIGNVRTTTMRAFGRGEFEDVVGKAG